MSKRILVTGGAGFIGSHLCKKLLERGNYVYCLDNFYTGKVENIHELIKNKEFELIKQDVVESCSIEIDEIYNLACPASPPHYQADPIKTTTTSVIGILRMLELAKAKGARILQASTSEVYGNPQCHPQKEEYWGFVNPIGVRSCYDEGKRCAESLVMDYHRQYGVDTRIVRIFNTYGPNMDLNDGRVVSNFIVQALLGKDITIYGDGSQTRSFCYISDLVEGLISMMEHSFSGPVNLGNPSEKTVLELAKLIKDMTKSESKIVFEQLPADDPVKRKPDITLAQKSLDWQPKISLQEGLRKTIEYFDKTLRNRI